MKTILLVAFLGVGIVGCATTKSDPIPVKVYQADASEAPALRKMPEGCRLVGTLAAFDQMEGDRYTGDPYRKEREETAAKGGNVLLVLSTRLVTRPNIDCPPSDKSPGCLRESQSWNRVAFESYACGPDAMAILAAIPAPPEGGYLTFPLTSGQKKPPVLTAQELKAKVLALMKEGVGTDVILTYVQGQRLKAKLTAEDILDWKRDGIADEVIKAAAAR